MELQVLEQNVIVSAFNNANGIAATGIKGARSMTLLKLYFQLWQMAWWL